jgi:hypothetical protein
MDAESTRASLAVVPHVVVVPSWPLASLVCTSSVLSRMKKAPTAMLDEGARGTWSSARSSGDNRHRASMEQGEEGITVDVASHS